MPPQTRSMSGPRPQRATSPVHVKQLKDRKRPVAHVKKPEVSSIPYKKKAPPKSLGKVVWRKKFGAQVGEAKCPCCENEKIYQDSFHCGHIIAEVHGGLTKLDNLIPVCSGCNGSMGTENFYEFKRRCGFKDTSKCTPKNFAQGLLKGGKPMMAEQLVERVADEYHILLAYETIFDLETDGKINRCDRKGEGFAGKYIRLTAHSL